LSAGRIDYYGHSGNKPRDDYDVLMIEDAAIARTLMWECDERLAGLTQSQADTAAIYPAGASALL